MKTTSFQGTVTHPNFGATRSAAPGRPQRPQATTAPLHTDSVRFGNDTEVKDKKTPENEKVQEPGFVNKSWQGLKRGLKDTFNLKSMGFDFLWGSAAAAASFIIPPHAHALLMIPLVMMTLGFVRFGKGVYKGFKGEP
jgi:hypothetical protein